jgi:hypothetical protein
MTWAETSSPAEPGLHPLAPPAAEPRSAPNLDRDPGEVSDLEAELCSWDEAPVALAEESGLFAMGIRAQALGYLWVELPPPGPEYRGRLGLYIEEGLETTLDQLGAPPAGIHASTSLDASLSDQLYRARFVERRGLALGIPSLEGIANLGRTLDADDSSVLRWWIAATADRPVRLVLSARNQFLRVYPSPVLFDSLFELAPQPMSPRAPSVALAESAQSMELSDLPPQVAERDLAPQPEPAQAEPAQAEPTQAEPTTNVLGTRVAPVNDVALPGLDRALGLLDEDLLLGDEGSAWAQAEPMAEIEHPSHAFPAAFDAAEQDAREAITLVPPPGEMEQVVEMARADAALTLSIPEEVIPLAPPAAAPLLVRPAESLAVEPARIDVDEFLRVLEADSQLPPPAAVASEVTLELASSVEADVEADRASDVPTPLPAKRLRRPFLRMADEAEPVVRSGPAQLEPLPSQPAHLEPAQLEPVRSESVLPELASSEPAPSESTQPGTRLPQHPSSATVPAIDASDPFNQLAMKEWRTWRDALSQAAGPRPLAAIERMFVTDYTRLGEAARRGIADETARAALEQWQASFQKSYAETFDALRVRGKRPTMVLDLPDIAQRLGRLQGARRVQLLLIDGLRFDLGLMVQDRLRARVDAALTERLLLWSALPSTTTYQLELLGKGPEGLLERFDAEESPALVARGRAARTARRIRTGRVEVQKIDVVEDALRTLGRPMLERFDDIANETADAIAEHMAAQAPRTLVIVFGDHGFRLDPAMAGTTEEVRQGGSSPEEVLVPAFAWLTGTVH